MASSGLKITSPVSCDRSFRTAKQGPEACSGYDGDVRCGYRAGSAENTHDMVTIILLVLSNIFMTFAWYGHLKHNTSPLWIAISASWGIAFFEYCLQVPANRIGFMQGMDPTRLKIIQEAITLIVFVVFVKLYFENQPFEFKYGVSFALIFAAVFVANYKW